MCLLYGCGGRARECGNIVAAPSDGEEATEKLYERHCLVSKIVSSFFACLTNFMYL